jgi:hypothetical protein
MLTLIKKLKNGNGHKNSLNISESLSAKNPVCSISLLSIVVFILLSSAGIAMDFESGLQYTFEAVHNENYIYRWSASSGNYQENDKSTFIWTSPEVSTPVDVVISLSVTEKTCSCNSINSKKISILPRKETKLDIKAISNNTNSTIISDNAELAPVLSNGTENSTATISISEYGTSDAASESPKNIMILSNQTVDTLSLEDSQSLDLAQNNTATQSATIIFGNDSNQVIASASQENASLTDLISGSNSAINIENDSANIAVSGEILSISGANPSQATEPLTDKSRQVAIVEKPSAAETNNEVANQNDQNAAEETCTLSFGDGVDINVVFEQSSSLADETHVVIDGAIEELISGNSPTDGTINPSTSINATSMPDSGMDQTGSSINQTQKSNAMPEIKSDPLGKTDLTIEPSAADILQEAVSLPELNDVPSDPAINQTDVILN